MNSYVFISKSVATILTITIANAKLISKMDKKETIRRHRLDVKKKKKKRRHETKPNTPRYRTTKQTKGNKNREFVIYCTQHWTKIHVACYLPCASTTVASRHHPSFLRSLSFRFVSRLFYSVVHVCAHTHICADFCMFHFRCYASAFQFVWFHLKFLLCAPKWSAIWDLQQQ